MSLIKVDLTVNVLARTINVDYCDRLLMSGVILLRRRFNTNIRQTLDVWLGVTCEADYCSRIVTGKWCV